jgi:protoheme IX farnesyltransferase
MRATLQYYFQLTKPSIMLLVLITGATALVWEGSFLLEPIKFVLVLIALYLTGGSANALNQYLERDIDARMSRTRDRRPLPSRKIKPARALVFSLAIGVIGVLMFAFWFNYLAAVMALATIVFYSIVYTLWLKPNTSQNIVIGGAAGAMAPVGAWAAASGTIDPAPWILFLIVFLWTPPHFWALAMYCKDDYVKAKLPMMPVVRGDRSTLNQMLAYSVALIVVSFSPAWFGVGPVYLTAAVLLGVSFLRRAIRAREEGTVPALKAMFGHSILYLFGLFFALILDVLLGRWWLFG